MAFVGVHPVLTQVPPNLWRSTNATFMPALASRVANVGPACPAPITIASYLLAMRTTVDQFQQNPAGALRMHEYIPMPARPNLDLVGNQPHAVFFQLFHRRPKIWNPQADMMYPLATLGDKLRNGRVF